jgi:hypothetical protein
LSRLDESARALGIFFNVHSFSLGLPSPPIKAWFRHLHWVSAGRVDVPQPASGRRHHFSGLPQMWALGSKTEEPSL